MGSCAATADLGPVGPGWIVRGFDRSLADERVLGDSPVVDGRYVLEYPRGDTGRRGRRCTFRCGSSARPRTLARSEVRFKAGPVEEIDVAVADQSANASLFERAEATVGAVLGDLDVADLSEDEEHQEVSFVAAASGLGREVVADLRDSHRLARGANLPPDVVFAWLRGGLRAPDVWATPPAPGRHHAHRRGLGGRCGAVRRRARSARSTGARAGHRPPARSDPLTASRAGWGALRRTLPQRLTPAKMRAAAEVVLDVPVDDAAFRERLREAKLHGKERALVERTARLALRRLAHATRACTPVVAE